MDKEEALRIISMIADGLDPFGEENPSIDLPEKNPVTMRAVCTAIISLLSGKDQKDLKPKYRKTNLTELMETVNGPLELYLKEKEKESIFSALYDAEYNANRAAEILGLTYEEFSERIKVHQISHIVRLKILWISVESDFLELLVKRYRKKTITLDKYLEILEKNAVKKALEKTNFSKVLPTGHLDIRLIN
jgi:hypothetical protein